MRDAQFQPMLDRMIERVQTMRPIPPCEDLEADTWGKVDKLLMKTLKLMKDRDVEQPMHALSEALFDIAARDVEFDKATQTVAYRAMDMRLLTDEYRRLQGVLRNTKEGNREPWKHFYPSPLTMIPPSIGEEVYRECMPEAVLRNIAGKLRRRGVLKGQQEDR